MKKEKICFICKKPIEGTYRMIALEIPYRNLFHHVECIMNKNNNEILELIKKVVKTDTKS